MADDKPYGEYGCFVDDFDGDTCVFDGESRGVHDCGVASTLIGDGKGRNDCPYWKRVSEEDPCSELRAELAALNSKVERLQKKTDRDHATIMSLGSKHAVTNSKVEKLEEALREARDFIMSGPKAGDEVAIVNKISRALEEK